MNIRTLLLVITMLFSTTVLADVASASAQDLGNQFSAEVQAISTEVAEIRVVSTTSAQVDGETYTIVEAEVTSSSSGQLGDRILLDVPGGTNPEGNEVIVSHQPYFAAGDTAVVAIVESPWQGFGGIYGDSNLPVYSVVGGLDGVSALPGTVVSQANASGDFALTGTNFGSFPVKFHVNAANSGVASSATIAAVKRGFDIWENEAGSDIDFTYGGTTTRGGNLGDGTNTIYWTATPNAADSYLAQASWTATQDGEIIGFDVKFNRDYPWSNGAVAGRWDIGTTTAHEAGHAIGLSHSSTSADVMYFQITSGRTKPLGPGDIAGAVHLYPTVSQDSARVAAAADIVDGLESYASAIGSYVVAGGGWQGDGQGWYKSFGSGYPASIRNVLSFGGHFPNGAPADPNNRDFLIFRCQDRVGVFSDTDTATTNSSHATWWNNNGCTQYPINFHGYTHLTLSSATPNLDAARLVAAADIVDGLESYASENGSYVASGGGWQGDGQGWYKSFPSGYPASIRNVLSADGHFPNGTPADPNNRDFLIFRCQDRIGVFSDTDTATTNSSHATWWNNNGCTQYPINFYGYTHLTLSSGQ